MDVRQARDGCVKGQQLDFIGALEFYSDNNASALARDLRRAIEAVADDVGVSAEAIRQPRGRYYRRLRLICIYLTGVVYDHSMRDVTRSLGLSGQAGSYTGQVIEDRRDDEEFDAWLDRLEQTLSRAA